jgi:hypothetical protein
VHSWDAQESSNLGDDCNAGVEEVVSTVAKRLSTCSKAELFMEFELFIVRLVEELALVLYGNLPMDNQEGVDATGLIELAAESAKVKLPGFVKNMVTLLSKEHLAKFREQIEANAQAAEAAESGKDQQGEEADKAGGTVKYLLYHQHICDLVTFRQRQEWLKQEGRTPHHH